MNNLKLREATRKLIKPCATCGGSGKEIYVDYKGDLLKPVCNTCKSKGYIDELEFGCEVIILNKDNKKESGIIIDNAIDEKEVFIISLKQERTYCLPKHIIENLGKPLELNELLEALGKKDIQYALFNKVENNKWVEKIEFTSKKNINVRMSIDYDIKLKPEQQSEEVLLKLIEILK